MFWLSSSDWKAMPISLFPWKTGPPLLPALTAASIWIESSGRWLWAYAETSMRETTPCVIERRSPPIG
jgi:hypothetical protein